MTVCELCNQPAIVHVTEISGGRPGERHFCGEHAEEYLGPGFDRDLSMPYRLSSLSPEAHQRLARAMQDVEMAAESPVRAADLVPAVRGLIGLLNDEEPCLRYLAAGWLGGIGTAEALAALRAAAHDGDPHVRDAVEAAIKKIEG